MAAKLRASKGERHNLIVSVRLLKIAIAVVPIATTILLKKFSRLANLFKRFHVSRLLFNFVLYKRKLKTWTPSGVDPAH